MSYPEEEYSWVTIIMIFLANPIVELFEALEEGRFGGLIFLVVTGVLLSVAIFLKDRPLHMHNFLWSFVVFLAIYLFCAVKIAIGIVRTESKVKVPKVV